MTAILINNGRVIDPASGFDAVTDVLIIDGRIAARGDTSPPKGTQRFDATGLIVCPGLVDALAYRVDTAAAVAGGVTTLALMPDQTMPLDDPALVERAARMGEGRVRIAPLVAATKALAGEELAEIGLCQAVGAHAVATGRRSIASAAVMYRLMQYAAGFGLPVISSCEDASLVAGACATEGEMATRLGLPAAPSWAETLIVERDLRLAAAAGARLHLAQVTCRASLDLVRAAKARGQAVTCGVTPAHMMLNDGAIADYRTFCRLSPPLRSETDRLAVIEALLDGTIDMIASGHDPRTDEEKRLPFAEAAPGMVGMETLLPLSLLLMHNHGLPLPQVLSKLTNAPAALLGLTEHGLHPGARADVIAFDPEAPWRVGPASLRSTAKNTPFEGLPVSGRVVARWINGVQVEA